MSLALHYWMRDAHHCSWPPRLRNDLYCVEWDVKLYYTILYHTITIGKIIWAYVVGSQFFKECSTINLYCAPCLRCQKLGVTCMPPPAQWRRQSQYTNTDLVWHLCIECWYLPHIYLLHISRCFFSTRCTCCLYWHLQVTWSQYWVAKRTSISAVVEKRRHTS